MRTKKEMQDKKEEIFDPLLDEIVSFFLCNIRKLHFTPSTMKSVQATVRDPIRSIINPQIIDFIMDNNTSFQHRINKRDRQLYKIENRTKHALGELIEFCHPDNTNNKKFIRLKRENSSRYLEYIINSDPFYSIAMKK